MKTIIEQPKKISIVPSKRSRNANKEFLQESVNKYLEALETQIGDLKKVGKNTLVIGGVIVAAYALTELLLPVATKKRDTSFFGDTLLDNNLPITGDEEKHEENSMIWTTLKGAAVSLLLTIAKDKILELIENTTTNNAESNYR